MPIIRVMNWPGGILGGLESIGEHQVRMLNTSNLAKVLTTATRRDFQFKVGLISALKYACLRTCLRSADDIIVTFGSECISEGVPNFACNRTLVVSVERFFSQSDSMRNELAKALGKAAKSRLPKNWEVAVIIQRFDPATDSYWSSMFDPDLRSEERQD